MLVIKIFFSNFIVYYHSITNAYIIKHKNINVKIQNGNWTKKFINKFIFCIYNGFV